MDYAIIIPTGPSAAERARAFDLVESLRAFAPGADPILLVDDGPAARALDRQLAAASGFKVIRIPNPRAGRGIGETSGLACGMLAALAWLHRLAPGKPALKLDTDALVIAPCAAPLAAALAAHPQLGMAGLFDRFCDGAPRPPTDFAHLLRKLQQPVALWRRPVFWHGYLALQFWGRGAVIRRQIAEALAAGYQPAEFVLGGAYLLSAEVIGRMAGRGLLADPLLWRHTHFSEDVVLSLYTRLVGLELVNLTGAGEPFAVQHYGLPGSPEQLLARGYSIIHSVKSDERWSEEEIREFFRQRRIGRGPGRTLS